MVFSRLSLPPSWGSFSTRVTFLPVRDKVKAVRIPAGPPPITMVCSPTSISSSVSADNLFALAIAIFVNNFAFSVAFSGSSLCTQLHWFRMFAISKRYLLSPASSMVSWNKGAWVLGEHAETTSLLSLCSSMAFLMTACASSEHANKLLSTCTTSGMSFTASLTASMSR